MFCELRSGKVFDPETFAPSDVDMGDICRGLAYQCRFNGHCDKFYSVAEHSIRVAAGLGEVGSRLWCLGLLHDAHEAYIGDVVTPVKRVLLDFNESWRRLENRTQSVIYTALGIRPPSDSERQLVRESDHSCLMWEKSKLGFKLKWENETVEDLWDKFEKVGPIGWFPEDAEYSINIDLNLLVSCSSPKPNSPQPSPLGQALARLGAGPRQES